jgi:hypothetical protein
VWGLLWEPRSHECRKTSAGARDLKAVLALGAMAQWQAKLKIPVEMPLRETELFRACFYLLKRLGRETRS